MKQIKVGDLVRITQVLEPPKQTAKFTVVQLTDTTADCRLEAVSEYSVIIKDVEISRLVLI